MGLREVSCQDLPKQNQTAKGRPPTKMQGRLLGVNCISCNTTGIWGQVSRELGPCHLPSYELMILAVSYDYLPLYWMKKLNLRGGCCDLSEVPSVAGALPDLP